MYRLIGSILALGLACMPISAFAVELTEGISKEHTAHSTSQWLEGAPDAALGFGLITLWGADRWKWFQQRPHFVDEHGFSNRSKTGGSDKTGHFGSAYLISEILTARLEGKGYAPKLAALTGSLYASVLMTWIEIGDSTSRYGFSKEDLAADYLGAGISYILRTVPEARSKLDLRLEYWPSSGHEKNKDIVADYSGMKHLMAVKFSGFEATSDNLLQYLEWQLGYYSRGYRSFDKDQRKRVLYTAIGINLSRLFEPDGWPHKTLRYVQVPYTYVPYDLYNSSR